MTLHSKKFIEIDQCNVIISAFKKSEDKLSYVLRIHEERGEQTVAKIQFSNELEVKKVQLCNILEDIDEESIKHSNTYYQFNNE